MYGPVPAGRSHQAQVRDELRVILERDDLEHAIIGSGSVVISADQQQIGVVRASSFDEQTGRLAAITCGGTIARRRSRCPWT
jgi:hypothetical protein